MTIYMYDLAGLKMWQQLAKSRFKFCGQHVENNEFRTTHSRSNVSFRH